jgi:type II secretory pathway component PulM
MKNWLNTLNPRERNLVTYGSIIAALLILGLFIVQPLFDNNKKLNKIISNKSTALKVMQKQSLQVKQLQQQATKPEQTSNQSPQQIIEKTLQTLRLKTALERMQSQGANGVNLVLKNANADRTMRLIADLEKKYGLIISSLTINTHKKEAGLIDVRLTVKAK